MTEVITEVVTVPLVEKVPEYPLELEFGRFKFIRLLAAGGQGSATLYHDTEEH
jgi:hypothetical protein